MSFHTRLDAGCGGVNDVLSETLGLENLEIDELEPIGRISNLDEPVNIADFSKMVKDRLNAPVVSYIGERPVKRIYITGGDGKDMIPRAIACGADTLLTGSVSYNAMMDADEMGINVIEAGHFYTENPVCKMLSECIKSIDNSLEIEIFNANKIKSI